MQLFDYIKVMFDSSSKYSEVTDYTKRKNSFMLNRFMSIKYPIQANLFNFLNTDAVGASDSWRRVTSQYKRTPGWVFTKVKKNTQKSSAKEYIPSDEAINLFMSFNQIGQREYKEAMKFNREETVKYLQILEKELQRDGGRKGSYI